MPLLDDILALLGTNRTRVAWKVRAWRTAWDRRVGSLRNRGQALSYAHQTCPRCTHPAARDEQVCSRCAEPLDGLFLQRARRLGGMLWLDGAPVAATLLVAAIAAMYATTLIWGREVGLVHGMAVSPHPLAFTRFGDLDTELVQQGEWWRLVTAMFLHVSVLHAIFNVLSLYSVARFLEEVLGTAKTLALYLGLGLAASLASFAWHAYRYPYAGNSAGASGAICGLIGVAIGVSLRRRNVARHLRGHYLGWAAWIIVLGLSSWQIDNAAHIGGLVPGVLVGLLVRRRADTRRTARRAWMWLALALTLAAIVALGIAAGQSVPDDVLEAWRAA